MTDPISGETFQYDGFGNLNAKVLNGTTQSMPVNGQTNQLTNAFYDANGNMASGLGASLTYDGSNRMVTSAAVSGGMEYYGYGPDNKRMYKKSAAGVEEWTAYGPGGEELGRYTLSATTGEFTPTLLNVWFGGRLVATQTVTGVNTRVTNAVLLDRLGTNRAGGARFLPYGDEITSTANDREKFGTYTRDSYTGLDISPNRAYASTYGRFNTADPYRASGGPANPSSWNRYSYVEGDPVNYYDPSGLVKLCGLWCNYNNPAPYEAATFTGALDASSYFYGVTMDSLYGIDARVLAMFSGSGQPIAMIPDGNSAHQSAVAHTKTALRNALSRNTDCVKWLESGAGLNQSGFDQVWSKITVGPYTFVGGQPTAVTGSPLSPGDNIAINAGGLFFGGSGLVAIGVNGIYANTDSGREFILLHEMAHVYGASGFNQNDGGSNNTKAQTDNNNLIMKNCGSIFSAGTA